MRIDLGFRVAEPDVELQDLRSLVGQHQAGVDHAPERPAGRFSAWTMGTRISRSTSSMRAGVTREVGENAPMPPVFGPFVVVEGPLVVLAGDQGHDRPAVGQGEDAGLLAVESLLDEEPVAGLAENASDHDLVDGLQGLAEGAADVNALARGQAVGLDHDPERTTEDEVAAPRRIG